MAACDIYDCWAGPFQMFPPRPFTLDEVVPLRPWGYVVGRAGFGSAAGLESGPTDLSCSLPPMVDSTMLGTVTATCMDALDRDFVEDPKLLAVAVICVVEDAGATYTRVYTSESTYYSQVGLLRVGVECVESGTPVIEGEDE